MLDRVRIHGFRSARDVTFAPGPLCALAGEASSGKSTVLSAVWALLDASAPVPTLEDVSEGSGGRVHLEADVGERTIFLDTRPPATLNLNREGRPPTLFLPSGLRSRTIVAPTSTPAAVKAARVLLPEPSAPADGGSRSSAGSRRSASRAPRGSSSCSKSRSST
ncbi:MAG TPA: hypothetical protein VIU44_08565 [Gaiellaceae bacterium]